MIESKNLENLENTQGSWRETTILAYMDLVSYVIKCKQREKQQVLTRI